MINHIDSTLRTRSTENAPFKLAQILLDASLLDKLFLRHIPADEIHLKTSLLKNKYQKSRQISDLFFTKKQPIKVVL